MSFCLVPGFEFKPLLLAMMFIEEILLTRACHFVLILLRVEVYTLRPGPLSFFVTTFWLTV